jgi:hypothetical protein
VRQVLPDGFVYLRRARAPAQRLPQGLASGGLPCILEIFPSSISSIVVCRCCPPQVFLASSRSSSMTSRSAHAHLKGDPVWQVGHSWQPARCHLIAPSQSARRISTTAPSVSDPGKLQLGEKSPSGSLFSENSRKMFKSCLIHIFESVTWNTKYFI